MVVCAVKLCRNYTGKNVKPSEDISFHRFPTDTSNRELWIRAIRRGADWTPGTHCRVCSVHFDDHDFKISETGRRILLKDAIPTKNLYMEERKTVSHSRTRKKGRRRLKPLKRHPASPSSLLAACRACLVTDTTLYGITANNLQNSFMRLTDIEVAESDGYPQDLCSVCFNVIEMFLEFKSRCQRAQDLLMEAKAREIEITTDFIRNIDRETNKLTDTQFTINKIPFSSPNLNIKEEQELDRFPIQNLDNIDSDNDIDDGFDIFDDENLATLKQRTDNVKIEDGNDVKNDHGNVQKFFETDHGNDQQLFETDQGNDPKLSELEHGSDQKAFDIGGETFGEPLIIHGTVIPKDEIFVDVAKRRHKKHKHGSDTENRKRKIKKENKQIKSEKLVKLEVNEDIRRSKPRKTDEDYENFAKDYSVDILFLTREEQLDEVLARRDSDNYKNAKLKCEDCFKGFSTEGAFTNHRTKHDLTAGNYECEFCKFRFPKRYKLLHHQTQHKNNFVCKICGHVSKLASKAMEHYKWHNGVKYPCQFCDKVFCKRTSQFNHMRMRHGSASCDICQEIFSGERGLLTHMQKAHKEAVRSRCEICGIQFHSSDALNRHIAAEQRCESLKACAECGCNFDSEASLHEHMRSSHWTEIKCEKCDAIFENEKLYRMHRVIHKEIRVRRSGGIPGAPGAPGGTLGTPGGTAGAPGGKRMRCKVKQKIQKRMCEMCGLTWRSAAALKYHQRVHTGEKPHQCPVCDKSFRIQDSLQIHMNTHTGARPFQCPHCPKAFKSRTQNHKHQLVHTKIRRYRCDLCDKTFQTSTCVKTHIRTVHMKIPLPPRVRHRNRLDAGPEEINLHPAVRPDLHIRLPSNIEVYTHMGMKMDGLESTH